MPRIRLFHSVAYSGSAKVSHRTNRALREQGLVDFEPFFCCSFRRLAQSDEIFPETYLKSLCIKHAASERTENNLKLDHFKSMRIVNMR
jgi:hypothetical protein